MTQKCVVKDGPKDFQERLADVEADGLAADLEADDFAACIRPPGTLGDVGAVWNGKKPLFTNAEHSRHAIASELVVELFLAVRISGVVRRHVEVLDVIVHVAKEGVEDHFPLHSGGGVADDDVALVTDHLPRKSVAVATDRGDDSVVGLTLVPEAGEQEHVRCSDGTQVRLVVHAVARVQKHGVDSREHVVDQAGEHLEQELFLLFTGKLQLGITEQLHGPEVLRGHESHTGLGVRPEGLGDRAEVDELVTKLDSLA